MCVGTAAFRECIAFSVSAVCAVLHDSRKFVSHTCEDRGENEICALKFVTGDVVVGSCSFTASAFLVKSRNSCGAINFNWAFHLTGLIAHVRVKTLSMIYYAVK